jgi:hypothetical protein
MRYVIAGLLVATFVAAPALADGSIEWSKMAPLLAENPAVRDFVEATLDVRPGGLGVRFGWMYPLGGARISPYRFEARRKGSQGSYDLDLTICTAPTFLDQDGKPATWDTAHSFTERLSFVAINEKSGKRVVTCDWERDV